MPLMSKSTGKGNDFEPAPEGTHVARCISVIDLGFQESEWQGQTKIMEKVYIGFEIPGFRVKWTKDDVEHEGPGLIGSLYTNSIFEKANLGSHLISWRGRAFTDKEKEGFDLFTILDVPCLISVVHKQSKDGSKTYANIGAIMGLPKGTTAPDRETDILGYSPNDPDRMGCFDKIPEWLQKIIAKQVEPVEESENPEPKEAPDEFDDSIPF